MLVTLRYLWALALGLACPEPTSPDALSTLPGCQLLTLLLRRRLASRYPIRMPAIRSSAPRMPHTTPSTIPRVLLPAHRCCVRRSLWACTLQLLGLQAGLLCICSMP